VLFLGKKTSSITKNKSKKWATGASSKTTDSTHVLQLNLVRYAV
jgi:hypothetical protein